VVAVALAGLMLAMQVISDGTEPQVLTVPAAPPIPEETVVLADEVGLDPVQLQGAVGSVRASPRTYLEHEGLIARPVPQAPPGAATTSYGLWDRLAACESNGRWNAATGNGYYGGLQFDQLTWRSYGGLAYAPSANLASKAQQIAVAERLRAARGMQPWPVCGRRV
jgi:hypothetical protein